jgi:hypothetical protein
MLICLKPGKSKAYCENRICKKRLIGQFKVLRRGVKGYAFHVCLKCFESIEKKGGPDRYLPGKALFKIVGRDESTGAELHSTESEPYVPVGTHKLDGTVEIVSNPKTGQMLL